MSGIHSDLTEALFDRIAELPRGTRLPSETELMEEFRVSRGTVRQALSTLERSHAVVRRQGMGTFVARPYDCRITQHTHSFHGQIAAGGGTARTVSVGAETVPAPGFVAAWLGLAEQTPLVRLQRLGYVDSQVAVHLREHFAPDVVHEVGVAIQVIESVDDILSAAGYEPYRAACVATIVVPTGTVRHHLELGPGEPVWRVDSLLRDRRTGRPLIVSRNHSRLDLVRIIVDLDSSQVNEPGTRPPNDGEPHGEFTAAPPARTGLATSRA